MSDLDITALQGRHVLVVEDEALVAMALIDELEQVGAIVVGPAASLESALDLIANTRIDAAILDVELQRKAVYPAAEMLAERAIPFILTTGHDDQMLPERYANVPRSPKPASSIEVLETLARAIGRPSAV